MQVLPSVRGRERSEGTLVRAQLRCLLDCLDPPRRFGVGESLSLRHVGAQSTGARERSGFLLRHLRAPRLSRVCLWSTRRCARSATREFRKLQV